MYRRPERGRLEKPNMMKRTMLPSLAAAALSLGASVAAAQEVPTLDVAPLCRAQAKASQDLADACLADEKKARDELVRRWAQFACGRQGTVHRDGEKHCRRAELCRTAHLPSNCARRERPAQAIESGRVLPGPSGPQADRSGRTGGRRARRGAETRQLHKNGGFSVAYGVAPRGRFWQCPRAFGPKARPNRNSLGRAGVCPEVTTNRDSHQ